MARVLNISGREGAMTEGGIWGGRRRRKEEKRRRNSSKL